MSSLFGKPPSAPRPPKMSDSNVQAAAEAERRRAALAMGRSSTILGGQYSASDQSKIGTKNLLGG